MRRPSGRIWWKDCVVERDTWKDRHATTSTEGQIERWRVPEQQVEMIHQYCMYVYQRGIIYIRKYMFTFTFVFLYFRVCACSNKQFYKNSCYFLYVFKRGVNIVMCIHVIDWTIKKNYSPSPARIARLFRYDSTWLPLIFLALGSFFLSLSYFLSHLSTIPNAHVFSLFPSSMGGVKSLPSTVSDVYYSVRTSAILWLFAPINQSLALSERVFWKHSGDIRRPCRKIPWMWNCPWHVRWYHHTLKKTLRWRNPVIAWILGHSTTQHTYETQHSPFKRRLWPQSKTSLRLLPPLL